jgi:hypothetical protein
LLLANAIHELHARTDGAIEARQCCWVMSSSLNAISSPANAAFQAIPQTHCRSRGAALSMKKLEQNHVISSDRKLKIKLS